MEKHFHDLQQQLWRLKQRHAELLSDLKSVMTPMVSSIQRGRGSVTLRSEYPHFGRGEPV